jgi:hypothetical protein
MTMTEDNKDAMEGTAKYVNNLPAIVEQLERCGYQTADGLHNLSMNAAFIALKEIAAKSEGGENEGAEAKSFALWLENKKLNGETIDQLWQEYADLFLRS